MSDYGRMGWREREVLLKRASGCDNRIMLHVEGVELEWNTRMVVAMMRHPCSVRNIKSIIVQIAVYIIRHRQPIARRDMRGEVGRSFPGVLTNS